MEAAFDHHDISAPCPNAIRRIIGLPLSEAIGILAPGTEISFHDRVAETYKSLFRFQRASGGIHEPLYPGVEKSIKDLHAAGWLLGIATGKAMRGLIATLEPHGFFDYFITRQTADVAMGKPHPDMLNKAMADTGVDADATVMIGDTTYDMEMARNAGTKSIGVSWGYHPPEELLTAGAHVVIDGFEALVAALESLTENEV